jgi:hypothetical protein
MPGQRQILFSISMLIYSIQTFDLVQRYQHEFIDSVFLIRWSSYLLVLYGLVYSAVQGGGIRSLTKRYTLESLLWKGFAVLAVCYVISSHTVYEISENCLFFNNRKFTIIKFF